MKSLHRLATFLALSLLAVSANAADKILFNGKDLTGWKGLKECWSVRDGAITGKTMKSLTTPIHQPTFLVWDGEVTDFELTFQYKILDANGKSDGSATSGVQYRSKVVNPTEFIVSGYRANISCTKFETGLLYAEKYLGAFLAKYSQKVLITEGKDAKTPVLTTTGSLGDAAKIQAKLKPGRWNEYRIVAKGNQLQHFVNGAQVIDVTDQTAAGAKSGSLALYLQTKSPMTVQFKDLVLKEIK